MIDVALEASDDAGALVKAWRKHARRALNAVGWSGEKLTYRRNAHGVSLALSAPIDALYAATEVNEYAYQARTAELAGESAVPDFRDAAKRLRETIAEERNPRMLAMQAAAAEHGVAFLWDDDRVSVGMGKGSRTWPSQAVPDPAAVDWPAVSDVPVALITGTNGKTTTVRLLAAMARAAGRRPRRLLDRRLLGCRSRDRRGRLLRSRRRSACACATRGSRSPSSRPPAAACCAAASASRTPTSR